MIEYNFKEEEFPVALKRAEKSLQMAVEEMSASIESDENPEQIKLACMMTFARLISTYPKRDGNSEIIFNVAMLANAAFLIASIRSRVHANN